MINQVQKKNRQNILKYVVNYSHSKGLLNIQCVPVTLLYRDYNKKKPVFVLCEICIVTYCIYTYDKNTELNMLILRSQTE